jgi:hypothetical protein
VSDDLPAGFHRWPCPVDGCTWSIAWPPGAHPGAELARAEHQRDVHVIRTGAAGVAPDGDPVPYRWDSEEVRVCTTSWCRWFGKAHGGHCDPWVDLDDHPSSSIRSES